MAEGTTRLTIAMAILVYGNTKLAPSVKIGPTAKIHAGMNADKYKQIA